MADAFIEVKRFQSISHCDDYGEFVRIINTPLPTSRRNSLLTAKIAALAPWNSISLS